MKSKRLGCVAAAFLLACAEVEGPTDEAHRSVDIGRQLIANLARRAMRAPARSEGREFVLAAGVPGAPSSGLGWERIGTPVRARLGASANEPMLIEGVRVSRLGATDVTGRIDEGAVVFEDEGLESHLFTTGWGVEELWLVQQDRELGYRLELPSGWRLERHVAGAVSVVLARDARGAARLRMTALAAWDATGEPIDFGVQLDGDNIRFVFEPGVRFPVVVDPEWTSTTTPGFRRTRHTSTLLGDGRVLLSDGSFEPFSEVFDPTTGVFDLTGSDQAGGLRFDATATILPSGSVFIAGGTDLYLPFVRPPDLVDGAPGLTTTKLFDPESNSIAPGPQLPDPLIMQSSSILQDGSVLLVGGGPTTHASTAAAARYFPASSSLQSQAMLTARRAPVSALLGSGHVLIVGGGYGSPLQAVELFDPITGEFQFSGELVVPRYAPTLTLLASGEVLVTGGEGNETVPYPAEIYHPDTGSFTLTGTPAFVRRQHTATLLPTGEVLLVGGYDGSGAMTPETELYNPETGQFAEGPTLMPGRYGHGATLLPSGRVLITGGSEANNNVLQEALLLDATPPVAREVPITTFPDTTRCWGIGYEAAAMPTGEIFETVTDEVCGDKTFGIVALYDPVEATSEWGPELPSLRSGRRLIVARTGDLMFAGGMDQSGLSSAEVELFNPFTRTFHTGAPLLEARSDYSATVLPDGRVLFLGGKGENGSALFSAETYDPTTQQRSSAGAILRARINHAAALLPDGRVLVGGGTDAGQSISTLEIFDPEVGNSELVSGADMVLPNATSQVLPGGDILFGGAASYRYSVATNLLSLEPMFGLVDARGDVVNVDFARCFELYPGASSPVETELVEPNSTLTTAVTSVSTGGIFLGGLSFTYQGVTALVEWVPTGAKRPEISSLPAQLAGGETIQIQGRRFQHKSAVGAGNGAYASVQPLVFLMPFQGGGPLFGTVTQAADTTLSFRVPVTVRQGPAWLHVVSEGVPSVGRYVLLQGAPLAEPCSANGECATGHCAQGICCNEACDGGCESCRAQDKSIVSQRSDDGSCGPVVAESDPYDACAHDGPQSCGSTGVCDGAGSCSVYADGTACRPGSFCEQGVCTSTGQCVDDHTVVLPSELKDCGPYRCSTESNTCFASCVTTRECVDGFVCSSAGTCESPIDPGPGAGCSLRRTTQPTHAGAMVVLLGLLGLSRRRQAGGRGAGWRGRARAVRRAR